MKPTGKNVIIQLITPTKTTKSGIILQEEENKHVLIGNIVDVGPQTSQAEKGLTAYVNKYSVGDIKPDEGDFVIVEEADILFMVEK